MNILEGKPGRRNLHLISFYFPRRAAALDALTVTGSELNPILPCETMSLSTKEGTIFLFCICPQRNQILASEHSLNWNMIQSPHSTCTCVRVYVLCVCMRVWIHVSWYVGRSEDLWKSVISCHEELRNQTQVTRLGSKHLYFLPAPLI